MSLQFQNHYLSNKKHCMQIAIHRSQNALKSYYSYYVRLII